MNENIKDVLKLIEEHSDLPVVPMVGQDIVADSFGEWTAEVGEANRRLKAFIDSLDWLEAIIVHIETPTIEIPDNTEKINELLEG